MVYLIVYITGMAYTSMYKVNSRSLFVLEFSACICTLKNSCEFVYSIPAKNIQWQKRNDSIFSLTLHTYTHIMKIFSIFQAFAHSELWIHMKTQAFIINSKVK